VILSAKLYCIQETVSLLIHFIVLSKRDEVLFIHFVDSCIFIINDSFITFGPNIRQNHISTKLNVLNVNTSKHRLGKRKETL